ncbi:MAG: response regulator [Bacteroidota bacterium]
MKVSPKQVMVLDHDTKTAGLCRAIFEDSERYQFRVERNTLRDAILNQDLDYADLLITETKVNGQSSFRYIANLLRANPALRVLIVSSVNDFDVIRQAFRLGVNGYLTKPLTIDRLMGAIKTIEEEGTALSSDVSKKIVSVFQQQTYEVLSRRENQIVNYLGQGATY